MLQISSSARLIDYKAPIPLKIVLGVGLAVIILVTWSAVFDNYQYGFAMGFFSLGSSLALFLYTNNSGYRIAWDDDRVYMRNWGFRNLLFQRQRFHGIAYDDIMSMEGRFGNNAAAKSRFMPYEYLEIASRRPDEEDIWVYPLSLKTSDLREFLAHLRDRRPDIFPDEITELIRKDGLI